MWAVELGYIELWWSLNDDVFIFCDCFSLLMSSVAMNAFVFWRISCQIVSFLSIMHRCYNDLLDCEFFGDHKRFVPREINNAQKWVSKVFVLFSVNCTEWRKSSDLHDFDLKYMKTWQSTNKSDSSWKISVDKIKKNVSVGICSTSCECWWNSRK